MLEILIAEGASVAVGEPIARMVEAASLTAPAPPARAHAESAPPRPEPSAPPQPVVAGPAMTGPVGSGNGRGGLAATPLARRIAETHGIALDDIEGTGPLGRITRADVLLKAGVTVSPEAPLARLDGPAAPPAADSSLTSSSVPGRPLSAPSPAAGVARRQELTRLQQIIARRMAEAKATIPHFQVQTDVAMDAALALRGELANACDEGDPVPSVNDLIVKAAALALRGHPLANGSYSEDGFVLHDAINVGVAVAADAALIVPTVFDAAAKSIGEIARETRRLAQRARAGQIAPAELEGATFTVSNLGMYGMTAITPVINPPQAAILGVGAARQTLARVDGEIVERQLMALTLSCDHRILYGADAARFLADIRNLLETPLKLAL